MWEKRTARDENEVLWDGVREHERGKKHTVETEERLEEGVVERQRGGAGEAVLSAKEEPWSMGTWAWGCLSETYFSEHETKISNEELET